MRLRYRTEILVSLGLVLLTAGAFGHVVLNGFVNYDDAAYVTANPQVTGGLSRANVVWALTTTRAGHWHPLTWLSLQLDASLYGPTAAWGFHLTALLLHAATAVVLFLALRYMTGATWCSAAVAALFAVHPLRVESVAWASERKDVLSGLMWMVTLLAYAWYVRRPGWARYLLVILAFALGLTAKPMLVTLPCVLLLLDYWPLRRVDGGRWTVDGKDTSSPSTVHRPPSTLLLEKLPLFALSAASCVLAFYCMKKDDSISSLGALPLSLRLENSLVAYTAYLGKTFWPTGLVPFYPYPREGLPPSQVGRAVLLLAVVSALVLWARRRRYLAVGWLWFLGTLVPVIGLIQQGSQAMADHYSYIPSVGVYLALVWGAADLTARWPRRVPVLAAAMALLLAACVYLTAWQVRVWQNSLWLWEYTLQVTEDNWVAHVQLGKVFIQQGRDEEAAGELLTALRLGPPDAESLIHVGRIRMRQGRPEQAVEFFARAYRLDSSRATLLDDWGLVLVRQGHFAEAVAKCEQARRLDPSLASAQAHLGVALGWLERWDEACAALREAVGLAPQAVDFRADLAWALWHVGQTQAAREEYEEVTRRDGRWLERTSALARTWAADPSPSRRNAFEAVRLAEQVCQATDYREAHCLDTLAAAYAEAGKPFPATP